MDTTNSSKYQKGVILLCSNKPKARAYLNKKIEKEEYAVSRWKSAYSKNPTISSRDIIDFMGQKHTYMSRAAMRAIIARTLLILVNHGEI